jgi:hypothetical protein
MILKSQWLRDRTLKKETRPTLPWWLEDDTKNPFIEPFLSPAPIMAYVVTERPELTKELVKCVIEAGASSVSLAYDTLELCDANQEHLTDLAELIADEFENVKAEEEKRHEAECKIQGVNPKRTRSDYRLMSMTELDFLPDCLDGAEPLLLQATAAITCKIARNTDPLRGDFASNSDPS